MIRSYPGEATEAEKADKEGDKKKGAKNKKNEDQIQAEMEEAKKELEAELALEWVGVDHYEQFFEQEPKLDEVDHFLPDKMDVLEGLGLGPNGPPIPEPTTFSVVPKPDERAPPLQGRRHFEFIATGPDDPNVDQNDNDDLANADQDSLADNEVKQQREAAKETKSKKKPDKGARDKSASGKGKATPKTPTEDEVKKVLRLAKYRSVEKMV